MRKSTLADLRAQRPAQVTRRSTRAREIRANQRAVSRIFHLLCSVGRALHLAERALEDPSKAGRAAELAADAVTAVYALELPAGATVTPTDGMILYKNVSQLHATFAVLASKMWHEEHPTKPEFLN